MVSHDKGALDRWTRYQEALGRVWDGGYVDGPYDDRIGVMLWLTEDGPEVMVTTLDAGAPDQPAASAILTPDEAGRLATMLRVAHNHALVAKSWRRR